MEILVIDSDPAARAVLLGRLQELKRSNELKRIEPVPLLPKSIDGRSFGPVAAVILGAGLASSSETVMSALRVKAHCPIAALFHPAPAGAVSLASDSDEALKIFLVQALAQSQLARLAEARKIIGIAQLCGGVGATTLTIEIGKVLASQGVATTLVDFDDVNPTLSSWAKSAPRYRSAVSEALQRGNVTDSTIDELLVPVSNNLTVVPQPESYAEAFHFKSNVIEDAPVSSVMVNSLLSALRARNSTVLIDLARSWGLATFAALPRCGQIILVISGETTDRVKSSIEALRRLKRESDAAEEFDTLRWSIVATRSLPSHTDEIRILIQASNLFPESVAITFLSDSSSPTFAAAIKSICAQIG